MHLSLEKADVELNLLKRLNAVSLWTTVMELVGTTGDDKKAIVEAKTAIQKRIKDGGMSVKMWEHTFRRARRWSKLATRFGIGMLFYLPVNNSDFTTTWYDPYLKWG